MLARTSCVSASCNLQVRYRRNRHYLPHAELVMRLVWSGA